MKFQIKRTSIWDDVKPCDEAIEDKLVSVDVRSVSSPDKLSCMTPEKWYSEGTNHRTINGNIARDLDKRDCYTININTLKDLMELQNKYGDLVIGTSYIDRITPSIEIYDDYRE